MPKGKILIVDDEPLKILTLKKQLEAAGFRTITHADPEKALETLSNEAFDLMVTDLRMPGLDGIRLLELARQRSPNLQVILMTAYGSIDTAVEAMKLGACDYVTKPFAASELIMRIESLLSVGLRTAESCSSSEDASHRPIIGEHPSIQQCIRMADKLAGRETTALIQGESGSGKGLLAEYTHCHSQRKGKPFIKVSCASLSKDIFESELFGHEKGAFTGAAYTRKGRFELAEGGTLFLDEVDDVPLNLQVKLLRFLEEKEFERVGGEVTLHGDVRVIGASKEDLLKLVKERAFRQDLYYRLNIVQITIPPLRERSSDIPLITEHFLKKFSGGRRLEISTEAMARMMEYPWPGNIRELENCIERAIIMKSEGIIEPGDLPLEVETFHQLIPEVTVPRGKESIDFRVAVRDTQIKLIQWA
jgi:DNA-binding NtrC family response regulator